MYNFTFEKKKKKNDCKRKNRNFKSCGDLKSRSEQKFKVGLSRFRKFLPN